MAIAVIIGACVEATQEAKYEPMNRSTKSTPTTFGRGTPPLRTSFQTARPLRNRPSRAWSWHTTLWKNRGHRNRLDGHWP